MESSNFLYVRIPQITFPSSTVSSSHQFRLYLQLLPSKAGTIATITGEEIKTTDSIWIFPFTTLEGVEILLSITDYSMKKTYCHLAIALSNIPVNRLVHHAVSANSFEFFFDFHRCENNSPMFSAPLGLFSNLKENSQPIDIPPIIDTNEEEEPDTDFIPVIHNDSQPSSLQSEPIPKEHAQLSITSPAHFDSPVHSALSASQTPNVRTASPPLSPQFGESPPPKPLPVATTASNIPQMTPPPESTQSDTTFDEAAEIDELTMQYQDPLPPIADPPPTPTDITNIHGVEQASQPHSQPHSDTVPGLVSYRSLSSPPSSAAPSYPAPQQFGQPAPVYDGPQFPPPPAGPPPQPLYTRPYAGPPPMGAPPQYGYYRPQ